MSAFEKFERGAPDVFEVIYRSGHVERLLAHQVMWKGGPDSFSAFLHPGAPTEPARVMFHGEVDGHWKLLLDVLAEDVVSIRNVTQVGDSS